MDLSEVKVDGKTQSEGVWVEHDTETSFLVARMGNPKFKQRFGALMAPHQRRYDAGKLSNEMQSQIMAKAVSETILLGWKGLQMDGKELKYSTEKAYEILADPTAEEFLALILEYAQDNERFRNAKLEEMAKN
jgi:hypothetical protein